MTTTPTATTPELDYADLETLLDEATRENEELRQQIRDLEDRLMDAMVRKGEIMDENMTIRGML